jgi:arylsulfatase
VDETQGELRTILHKVHDEMRTLQLGLALACVLAATGPAGADVVHDAEYYVLEAQHGNAWRVEDDKIDARLAKLRKKYGTPPNIVHILWDDTSFGDVGIPAINKIRGFETPGCNRMAEEGILFTRMYTEPSCTPSRAACMTGQHPVRNGSYLVRFPLEYGGLGKENVTVAEVLSQAGYATAFYGKWHLGDIEESYPHNQGFDETLFSPYNQVLSLWNRTGEAVNAMMGLYEDMIPDDGYRLDNTFVPKGWVMTIEGTKGGDTREWADTSHDTYLKTDPECQKRTLAFINKNAKAKKPFYVAYWPNLVSFMPSPKKLTPGRGIFTDGMQYNVDAFIGRVMDELNELGIAENTLVIAMADNGPMAHNPPPGLGMTETIFRGGKGDFLEGGVRVPAFAWWPGVIEPGQIVGDIIHEADLYTTFARLGGATKHIPTDRIVDGVDQTSLLVNGDTHSRRDYVHIYTGNLLGASVKGHWKRHWINPDPTSASGIGAAYYFLLHDTREKNPMLVNALAQNEAFTRMRVRHELMKKKYPDKHHAVGMPFTGLSNARPETRALWKEPPALKRLPFDIEDVIDFDPPWEMIDPEIGE